MHVICFILKYVQQNYVKQLLTLVLHVRTHTTPGCSIVKSANLPPALLCCASPWPALTAAPAPPARLEQAALQPGQVVLQVQVLARDDVHAAHGRRVLAPKVGLHLAFHVRLAARTESSHSCTSI